MLHIGTYTIRTNVGHHTCLRTTCLNRPYSSCVFRTDATRYPIPSTSTWTRIAKIYSRSSSLLEVSNSYSPVTLDLNREDPVDKKFNWFKNWWPVQIIENLETDRPNKIQLLNKHFIVWKGHSGDWIAMNDECPHRMAPLSEGRIEKDGNLLCSYHAWRFNEHGKCVKIPHAEDEKAHFVACSTARSSVHTYPCMTYGGILWIWPDDSLSAFANCTMSGPPIEESIATYLEQSYYEGSRFDLIRYLPYSYDILVENLLDPAHYIVSHHGVHPGISRYNAAPIHVKLADPLGRFPVLVSANHDPPVPSKQRQHVELRTASTVFVCQDGHPEEQAFTGFVFLISPVCSGRSLIIVLKISRENLSKPIRLNPIQRYLNSRINSFFLHVTHNKTLDGDNIFLHELDKKIRQQDSDFISKENYYVPTDADVAVIAFRKWFEGEGDNGRAYGGNKATGVGIKLTKKQLLNRYEQHTKHCRLCRELLTDVHRATLAFKALFAVSTFVASVLFLRLISVSAVNVLTVIRNTKLVVSMFLSVISSSIVNILEKNIIPQFYFIDHSHADMD